MVVTARANLVCYANDHTIEKWLLNLKKKIHIIKNPILEKESIQVKKDQYLYLYTDKIYTKAH